MVLKWQHLHSRALQLYLNSGSSTVGQYSGIEVTVAVQYAFNRYWGRSSCTVLHNSGTWVAAVGH